MKIEFLQVGYSVDEEYYPYPANKNVPEWFKKTPLNLGNGKDYWDPKVGTSRTVKACMPVLDSLTAGYIIPTSADILVSDRELPDGKMEKYFAWASGSGVDFQAPTQAEYHPLSGKTAGDAFPKWVSPWGVRTPAGYSCLFVSPLNNPNGFFTALPGIVDTDTYNIPVNFPFVLDDLSFTGIIPAGTPVVQVIPFKRDSWEGVINKKDTSIVFAQEVKLKAKMFSKYKAKFWNKKEFK